MQVSNKNIQDAIKFAYNSKHGVLKKGILNNQKFSFK